MRTVVVIGAAGHVGLPFCLTLAQAGFAVTGIDRNEKLIASLDDGFYPYIEDNGQETLKKYLGKNLMFTNSYYHIQKADVVAIMIGTPKDENGNPRIDDLMQFVREELITRIGAYTLIILRSTVIPGTTDLIIREIEELRPDLKEGINFEVAFCPERVQQGKSLVEAVDLPQLIGTHRDLESDKHSEAYKFFSTFVKECIPLTPKEAEYAKLVTNMYRYVNFALANEVYMLTRDQNVDIVRVIDAANKDYPRMNMPKPGPAAGPCLGKDGEFLLQNMPFSGLISSASRINEGLPAFLLNEALKQNPDIRTLCILGMTFKANSDDIRNSLSFKLKTLAESKGIKVYYNDPYWESNIELRRIWEHDATIIMTPHDQFKGLSKWFVPGPVLIDIWGISNA